MGELTPGTQLSMGSAKRLYVLMAGFYMQWAFKTSAVKSRHRIFTFRSPACYPRVSLLAPRVSSLCPETVREEEHFHPEVPATRPAASQIIYRACSERTDSHQDCHWEFTFNVQPQIPMTVAEPFGTQAPFSAWEDMWNSAWRVNAHKHERREAGGREQKHAAEIRRCWIILAIVINLSFELTSLVVPSKAKGGKERKKKKKSCLAVFAKSYNMLHASFGFPIHAKPKGCFGKTKSHTSQLWLTRRMSKGDGKTKEETTSGLK